MLMSAIFMAAGISEDACIRLLSPYSYYLLALPVLHYSPILIASTLNNPASTRIAMSEVLRCSRA